MTQEEARRRITVEDVLQQYGKIIWSTLIIAVTATGWTLSQLNEINRDTERLRLSIEQMRSAWQLLDRDGSRAFHIHLETSAERYRQTTDSLARIEERLGIKERQQ